MTLSDHQAAALDRLRRTIACARCGGAVTALPEHDRPDRVLLCPPCGRQPFATETRHGVTDLRRASSLAHEALGLAWSQESDPPLLEALTDLAELLDRMSQVGVTATPDVTGRCYG